jgi:hypothetical protein
MRISSTIRSGNVLPKYRRSDLRRRTITGSRSRGFTGTPTCEPLRIKDFEQRGKRIGVAVVGRGRKKETMLETLRKTADGAGKLAVDGIARAAGRRRMMRLVQYQ